MQSPLYAQMSRRLASTRLGARRTIGRAGLLLRRFAPEGRGFHRPLASMQAPCFRRTSGAGLRDARQVFETVDLFVAPSRSIATEFVRLGLDPRRVEVSDYGFPVRRRTRGPAA